MCGEMAGEPLFAPILLGLGIEELSMNPQSIPVVKNAIRSIDAADLEAFMQKVMQLSRIEAIQELLEQYFGDVVTRTESDQQES